MSIEQITNLIYAIGFLVTSVGTVINFIVNRQNGEAIQVVHKATNSMKDELVAEVRKAAYAQGRKDEGDFPGGDPSGKIKPIDTRT